MRSALCRYCANVLAKVSRCSSNITEHWLADSASVASNAAGRVAEILRSGIAARGTAGLAVSGGRSPIALFHELARQSLPWEQVSITLVDERWVLADNKDSNERLVREHLIRDAATKARFVPLKSAAATPQLALAEREEALKSLTWPLDAIVLGMGEDGHTASLFPGAANLSIALDVTRPALLAAIDAPDAEHPRISLTLRALLHTRYLALLIQNPRKRAIYQRARTGADMNQLPIAGVLAQRNVPIEVFWSP
jgi:6-phosphogluconolactonase